MKHFSPLTFLFLFISLNHSLAQTNVSEVIVGKAYQLTSSFLGEDVTFQISTPQKYNDTKEEYPVLYILDGQWFFSHGLSIRSDYTERNGPKITPDFIVVGITTDNSKRWEWAVEKTAYFLDFLEKEMLPFIDKNYRTSNDRILFGWETTGGFVVKSLSQKPNLFNAYIAASPAPLYGSYFTNLENEYREFESFLEGNKELEKYLFIGEGEADYPVQYGTEALDSLLTRKAPKKLQWKHKKMSGISHQMCAYHTLQQGLQTYYHYYHFLTYNSKTEFLKLGGLKYLDTFYNKRSDRLGTEDEEESKHATRRNLSFVAISEDDYEWFDFLFKEFEKDSFLEKSFAPHINDYAQFYLKNKNTEKALDITNFLVTKYPDNSQGYNSLGDIYSELNKMEEAEKFYEKAVIISRKNND